METASWQANPLACRKHHFPKAVICESFLSFLSDFKELFLQLYLNEPEAAAASSLFFYKI